MSASRSTRSPNRPAPRPHPGLDDNAERRMSKKTKARRPSTARSETYTLRPQPNWPLLALAGLGILLTAYLTWTALTGGAVQGCAVGGGCDTVLSSRWSKLLGLPT